MFCGLASRVQGFFLEPYGEVVEDRLRGKLQ